MTKDHILDGILEASLIIGSIWLGAKFLEALANKCPKCNCSLDKGYCPNCGWRRS